MKKKKKKPPLARGYGGTSLIRNSAPLVPLEYAGDDNLIDSSVVLEPYRVSYDMGYLAHKKQHPPRTLQ